MKEILNLWTDCKNNLGVVELKDNIFGASFHPIKYKDREYFFINEGLWYTTYHGAREFFRSKTNSYIVKGRMTKVESACYLIKVEENIEVYL